MFKRARSNTSIMIKQFNFVIKYLNMDIQVESKFHFIII